MGHGDGRGHEFSGLVAGVAEHHSLVAGTHQVQRVAVAALLDLEGLIDAHGDVGRLLVDGCHDGAGAVVKTVGRIGVADPLHGSAGNGRDIGVVGGGDLSHDHDHASGGEGLTGHMGGGVACQDIVQDRVGDLVAYLVWMSFGDGLGGEYTVTHTDTFPFFLSRTGGMKNALHIQRSARSFVSSSFDHCRRIWHLALHRRLPGFIGPFPPPLLIRLFDCVSIISDSPGVCQGGRPPRSFPRFPKLGKDAFGKFTKTYRLPAENRVKYLTH